LQLEMENGVATDYAKAISSLQESIKTLDTNHSAEQSALLNISKALVIVCEGLSDLDARVPRITYP
jgi:hypothetical protein